MLETTTANETNLEITSSLASIKAQSLIFHYPSNEALVLNDLSFEIVQGSLIILKGSSGSGKSTLLSLLLGFMKGYSGSLTINGSELSQISRQSLQQAICWSGQNPYLFHASLQDNLLLAKPDASPNELNAAIKKSGLSEFIDQLPQGLGTRLQERGTNISGGQLQRLALARAFLKNAPLLILD